ncbi:MAG: AAA family ATPase, partial [Roseiflexaceae bacterium]|nr:AAA family ATPase [Roseiflexaceae bacterium]
MTIQTVILDGFKSFRDRTEVTLGDLTILAGANSSGKSTIMQALLLMKQTLESVFDPGPLLMSGPHVAFSDTAQMVWSAPGEQRDSITL